MPVRNANFVWLDWRLEAAYTDEQTKSDARRHFSKLQQLTHAFQLLLHKPTMLRSNIAPFRQNSCSNGQTHVKEWSTRIMNKRVLWLSSLNAPRMSIELLRKNGHTVLWVIDLNEALSFIDTTQFDLVLVSAEQGEQKLEAIANATAVSKIPFVVIGDVSTSLRQRARAVIPSSISERQLLRVLFEDV